MRKKSQKKHFLQFSELNPIEVVDDLAQIILQTDSFCSILFTNARVWTCFYRRRAKATNCNWKFQIFATGSQLKSMLKLHKGNLNFPTVPRQALGNVQ